MAPRSQRNDEAGHDTRKSSNVGKSEEIRELRKLSKQLAKRLFDTRRQLEQVEASSSQRIASLEKLVNDVQLGVVPGAEGHDVHASEEEELETDVEGERMGRLGSSTDTTSVHSAAAMVAAQQGLKELSRRHARTTQELTAAQRRNRDLEKERNSYREDVRRLERELNTLKVQVVGQQQELAANIAAEHSANGDSMSSNQTGVRQKKAKLAKQLTLALDMLRNVMEETQTRAKKLDKMEKQLKSKESELAATRKELELLQRVENMMKLHGGTGRPALDTAKSVGGGLGASQLGDKTSVKDLLLQNMEKISSLEDQLEKLNSDHSALKERYEAERQHWETKYQASRSKSKAEIKRLKEELEFTRSEHEDKISTIVKLELAVETLVEEMQEAKDSGAQVAVNQSSENPDNHSFTPSAPITPAKQPFGATLARMITGEGDDEDEDDDEEDDGEDVASLKQRLRKLEDENRNLRDHFVDEDYDPSVPNSTRKSSHSRSTAEADTAAGKRLSGSSDGIGAIQADDTNCLGIGASSPSSSPKIGIATKKSMSRATPAQPPIAEDDVDFVDDVDFDDLSSKIEDLYKFAQTSGCADEDDGGDDNRKIAATA